MTTVALRLSLENMETVKKGLESLGPLGQKVMQQLETASQQPNKGLNFLSSIIDNLKGQFTGLAFSIGPVGSAMIGLGPVGLAAAAAIGLVVSALTSASERAEAFVGWAKELKQSAETAGLSISQLATLRGVGQQNGVDQEKTDKFVDRLTLSIEELRKGGGALFDVLSKIDSGLVRQVASARNNAEAIDLLAEAYANLGDQNRRNELVSAVGGRNNLGAGRLLGAIDQAGGLRAMEQAARDAGKAVDTDLNDRLIKTKDEIENIKKATDKIWGSMFTEETLNAQKRSAEFWMTIAQAAKSIFDTTRNMNPTEWDTPGGLLGRGRAPTDRPGLRSATDIMAGIRNLPGAENIPADAPTPITAALQLEQMRRWTSVLGDAITPSEQLRLKVLELAAAQERGSINDNQRARALGAFALAQDRAAVATRTQLGVASEDQILKQRLAELDDLQSKGFIKNAEERAAAERIVRREVLETAEALKVRNSDTPQLTRLTIESGKLKDSLDQGLSSALRGSTQSMVEMLKGTKSLGQGLSDLSGRILDAITNALLMKAIVSPLSSALSTGLSTLFGGGGDGGWAAGTTVTASALGNAFSGGRVVPFAMGGVLSGPTLFPMAGGNVGLGGEAGDEGLFPLRRMNNGKLGVHASGGGQQITVLHQVINNHPSAKVTQRDEDDGRGGRKTVTVIDEMMASAVSRPGSQFMRALKAQNNLVRG